MDVDLSAVTTASAEEIAPRNLIESGRHGREADDLSPTGGLVTTDDLVGWCPVGFGCAST